MEQVAARLVHRGPDGEGFLLDGAVGLAHRRLAIIDISGGIQPMSTADGSASIIYNGEVFNYLELFEQLKSRGHVPRTHSDTEAVLLAYKEWGLDFPSRLNGMFAIAIWDASLRRLVLCRDRMGVKPLYYAETPDGLVFASEIKALRVLHGVDTSLDLDAVDEYMTLGYVVHPRCMERGVKKLAPGTLATVDEAGGFRPRAYWSLRFEPDFGPSADQWATQIRALFDDAVKLSLRSDVPLGVLLSGGVDSTAIAATIAAQGGGSTHGIDSFCVGVDIPGAVTEFAESRRVSDLLGTRHHELRLNEEEHCAAVVEAAGLLDQPLAEPMVGQLLAVCRLARQHVTVLLAGDGSDETWFGYTVYRTMAAMQRAQNLVPDRLQRGMVPMLDRMAGALPMSSRAAKFLRLAAEPLERRYLGLNLFDTSVKDQLFTPDVRAALAGRDPRESVRRLYDGAGGPEPLSRMAAVDCRSWLVDNTLLRSDLMSMAASVELRVPFMDHRLVELAARVPSRFKVGFRGEKMILKRALADRLPPDVANRRKIGFPTPVAKLLRGRWGREARDTLQSPTSATHDLFDRARLNRMLDEHRAGQMDWSRQLLQVLMLEYWARAVDSGPPSQVVS
jgi:asparagine synthase (glutamine-hydrolysing)